MTVSHEAARIGEWRVGGRRRVFVGADLDVVLATVTPPGVETFEHHLIMRHARRHALVAVRSDGAVGFMTATCGDLRLPQAEVEPGDDALQRIASESGVLVCADDVWMVLAHHPSNGVSDEIAMLHFADPPAAWVAPRWITNIGALLRPIDGVVDGLSLVGFLLAVSRDRK